MNDIGAGRPIQKPPSDGDNGSDEPREEEGLMGRAWLRNLSGRTLTAVDLAGAVSAISLLVIFVVQGGHL